MQPRTTANCHCTSRPNSTVCFLSSTALPGFFNHIGSLGPVFAKFSELSASSAGQDVVFRARIHNSRAQGAKMVFLELRQATESIQALVIVEAQKVSKQMIKWAEALPRESLVLIQGTVQQPMSPVKSTTVQDAEIKINKVCCPRLLHNAALTLHASIRFISSQKSQRNLPSFSKMPPGARKNTKLQKE